MDSNHRLGKNDIKLVELFCQSNTLKYKNVLIQVFHEFYQGRFPKEFSIFFGLLKNDGSMSFEQKKYVRLNHLSINMKTKTITYNKNNYKHQEDDILPFPGCDKFKKLVVHLTDEGVKKIEEILKIHAEEDALWFKGDKFRRKFFGKKSRKTSRKKSRKTSQKVSRKKSRKTSRKTSRKKSRKTSRKKSRKTSRKVSRKRSSRKK